MAPIRPLAGRPDRNRQPAASSATSPPQTPPRLSAVTAAETAAVQIFFLLIIYELDVPKSVHVSPARVRLLYAVTEYSSKYVIAGALLGHTFDLSQVTTPSILLPPTRLSNRLGSD